MGTSRVEFGDKHITVAPTDTRGGDITRPKVHCVGEVSADMDVAGTIQRHPPADLGASAAEGGGPLMGTSRVEFGDKHICATR